MHPPTLVFGSAVASTGRGESESESEIEDDVKSIRWILSQIVTKFELDCYIAVLLR